MRYLGIDWGEKRIGLALGDSETKIATPFKVVGGINEIIKTIKDDEIGMVVVGAPLKMRNAKLKMQDEFLEFLNSLKKKINIPIKTIDERLTSKAADALIGGKKVKASRDAIAAMLILQNYLDRN
ncbi:Holliday junction resolvase RuvX [Candidatus Parcubacteria bacterium]|nr:Holliday junction resolvase RuvX [Patescibacteria group bacterium]MCG2691174.1 Holliday junction resolvase RuvX [Candidatus Parcubacteria bacterium]